MDVADYIDVERVEEVLLKCNWVFPSLTMLASIQTSERRQSLILQGFQALKGRPVGNIARIGNNVVEPIVS